MIFDNLQLTGEHVVALTGLLIGANGLAYTVLKSIAHYIAKWRANRNKDKESPFAKTADCVILHGTLLDKIKELIHEATAEMKSLSQDIKDMTRERTFEDDIRRRRDVIISNAVGCISNSKGVHDFAIHKAERFMQFVLDNYKFICDGEYQIFEERINSLAMAVKEEGKAMAGDDYVNFFYDKYHVKSTKRYLDDVQDIFDDKVNNKSERFALTSVEFLQRFMSEMVKAYVDWVQNSCTTAMNAMIVYKENDNKQYNKED